MKKPTQNRPAANLMLPKPHPTAAASTANVANVGNNTSDKLYLQLPGSAAAVLFTPGVTDISASLQFSSASSTLPRTPEFQKWLDEHCGKDVYSDMFGAIAATPAATAATAATANASGTDFASLVAAAAATSTARRGRTVSEMEAAEERDYSSAASSSGDDDGYYDDENDSQERSITRAAKRLNLLHDEAVDTSVESIFATATATAMSKPQSSTSSASSVSSFHDSDHDHDDESDEELLNNPLSAFQELMASNGIKTEGSEWQPSSSSSASASDSTPTFLPAALSLYVANTNPSSCSSAAGIPDVLEVANRALSSSACTISSIFGGYTSDSNQSVSPQPQVPRKRRRPATTEEERQMRRRERNRVAAVVCRQRKQRNEAELKDRVDFLARENATLLTTTTELRQAIIILKNAMLKHQASGCHDASFASTSASICV